MHGLDASEAAKHATDALIEAIWGPEASAKSVPPDPATRAAQNRALADAMRAYLQSYLDDM